MSRAALSVLPCKSYPPSSRTGVLATSPFTASNGHAHPVPARFIPAGGNGAPIGGGGSCAAGHGVGATRTGAGAATVAAKVTTTGSTVDRILGVAVSSLSILLEHEDSNAAAAATHGDASVPSCSTAPATVDTSRSANSTGCPKATDDPAMNRPSPAATSEATLPLRSLSATQLEQAMRLALAGAFDAVSAARLRWSDVASLRVYYCCPATSSAGSDAAPEQEALEGGGVDEELLKRAVFLALAGATRERPAVTFVPVCGLQDGAVVGVHMTAWSLDRLRTELWVRGAA